jgi:hypothetical protein
VLGPRRAVVRRRVDVRVRSRRAHEGRKVDDGDREHARDRVVGDGAAVAVRAHRHDLREPGPAAIGRRVELDARRAAPRGVDAAIGRHVEPLAVRAAAGGDVHRGGPRLALVAAGLEGDGALVVPEEAEVVERAVRVERDVAVPAPFDALRLRLGPRRAAVLAAPDLHGVRDVERPVRPDGDVRLGRPGGRHEDVLPRRGRDEGRVPARHGRVERVHGRGGRRGLLGGRHGGGLDAPRRGHGGEDQEDGQAGHRPASGLGAS